MAQRCVGWFTLVIVILVCSSLPPATGKESGPFSSADLVPGNGETRIAIYGTSITGFYFPFHMGRVLGRGELPQKGYPGHGTTREMLNADEGSVAIFKKDPYDIVIISWGLRDDFWGIPWNETMDNARRIFQALVGTGASVVFYNQVDYRFDEYERICDEEGVLFVRNATFYFGDPKLKADPIHPNEVGNGLLAELVARAMSEAGFLEGIEICLDQPKNLASIFSDARRLIAEAKDRNISNPCLEMERTNLAMAEYVEGKGHACTAGWVLEKYVIDSLETMLELEEEASRLFSEAMKHIQEAEEWGAANGIMADMHSWYNQAQDHWGACEANQTMTALRRISSTRRSGSYLYRC